MENFTVFLPDTTGNPTRRMVFSGNRAAFFGNGAASKGSFPAPV
jgi:hypothetical protein